MSLEQRYSSVLADLSSRGQAHLLQWWNDLSGPQRERLLSEIEAIPWYLLDPAISDLVRRRPISPSTPDLTPPKVYPAQPSTAQRRLYDDARRIGSEHLAAGKVAAFTVAGGQGTRLGVDGPKGAVVVTPIVSKSLFQLFAETVLAARKRYHPEIPWYVMTSVENHDPTLDFFKANDFFGLPASAVMFFAQGMLPALDFNGRALLAGKDHLALAPDGHGGSLKALTTSGALENMRRRGIDTISYFQVDNPLVHPFDPLFVGLHVLTESEMATKVSKKADDLEKVGNVCMRDGRVVVVEYSEFPEQSARAHNADGSRKFDAANLAMHLLNVDFVDRLAAEAALPFRRAEKVVPYVDHEGQFVKPDAPNAVKLETFVFDALPLAKNPLLLEVDRAEEFSPVKNPTGVDSLESAKRDQVLRSCRWLESVGVFVPRKPDDSPDATVFIGPSFALSAEEAKTRSAIIPSILRGSVVVLDPGF